MQTAPSRAAIQADSDARATHIVPSAAVRIVQKYGLIIAWLFIAIFFSVLPATSSTFPTVANLQVILGTQTVAVVITMGLLVPLVAGDFDLSVAFNLMLSSMVLAILNVNHHWPIFLAIAAVLAMGAVIGAVNASVMLFFGIDPFIVTLGTGTFLAGVTLWVSNLNTISGVSPGLVNALITAKFLDIPLEFYYGLVLCVVLWYVLDFTPLGRHLLIVGRARAVARLAGINVPRMRFGALVTSGVVSALAGIVYAGTSGAADPTSGQTYLLPAFSAAFLGSTAIKPGRFNPWGSLIAVYFLATGITGLELLGAGLFIQDIFYGASLVVAVAFSQLAQGRRAFDWTSQR